MSTDHSFGLLSRIGRILTAHKCLLVILVIISVDLFCIGNAHAQDGSKNSSPNPSQKPPTTEPPLRPFPAHVWTGKELVLWDGQRALAYDPDKDAWRELAANPYTSKNCRSIEMVCLSDDQLIVGYVEGSRKVCFNRYSINKDAWSEIEFVDKVLQEGLTGLPKGGILLVAGSTKVGDRALFFIACNYHGTKARGIWIDKKGTIAAINEEKAPHGCYGPVVYSDDRKVVYWGYWSVGAGNAGGIWDAVADKWQPIPSDFGDRYSYGCCFTGEEVVIFGGAYSSAFGYILPDGLIYSFKTDKWKKLPVQKKHAPEGRRDFYMCWTGKEVFIWGGSTMRLTQHRDFRYANGALFNLKTATWRPISSQDAPPPMSNGICVWTGREALVWGGFNFPGYNFDGYGYDPKENHWRKLRSVPAAKSCMNDKHH